MQYWWRCDYSKEIYRIWKVCAQGDLERLLALSGTSYKWLSHRGVHPSSGPIWYHWKAIFEENPTPYVMITKDEDYFLCKMLAITEIAPLGSFQRYWWLSNPDFSYLDVPPFCQGCSPSVWHWFGWDLGHFGAEIWLSPVGLWGSGYFYCGMGL